MICPDCNGAKRVARKRCTKCKGIGIIAASREGRLFVAFLEAVIKGAPAYPTSTEVLNAIDALAARKRRKEVV